MDDLTQATQQTEVPVAPTGPGAEQSQKEERKIIAIPADKWRDTIRDADSFRKQQRAAQTERTTNQPATPDPEQEALGKIADVVDKRLDSRFTAQEDRLDSLDFKAKLSELESDPNARYVQDEVIQEYARLSKENPKSSRTELLDQAQTEALSKAFRSGTLVQRIAEDVANKTMESLSSRRSASGGTGKAAPKTEDAKDYARMSPKEIAALSPEEEIEAQVALLGAQPRKRY